MNDHPTFEARCFCGAVRLEVVGAPAHSGYCHCNNCRSWHGAPVLAFTLWKDDAVEVTQGEDLIGEYGDNGSTYRQWCTACGGDVRHRHPGLGMFALFPAAIVGFSFEPEAHFNYASTVLPMKDALPKLKDFPTELGGSGELVTE